MFCLQTLRRALQCSLLLFPVVAAGQAPRIVKDINTQPVPAEIYYAQGSSGRDYFVAKDEGHGLELWTVDKAYPHGRIVKDIKPGAASGLAQDYDYSTIITGFSGRDVFAADDEQHGRELWVTDGTESETGMVFDFAPGAASSNPEVRGVFNNKLLVWAGGALWTSDLESTGRLTTIPVDGEVALHGDFVYFSSGAQLWRVNEGIEELVKDFELEYPGQSFSFRSLATAANALVFIARRSYTSELWRSDGTAAGTVRLQGHVGNSLIGLPNGRVLFQGTQWPYAMYSTDGTLDGTLEILIAPFCRLYYENYGWYYREGYYPFLGDSYYFFCEDDNGMGELWKSNGLPEGTSRIAKDLSYQLPVAVNGYIYFSTHTSDVQWALYKTNGTRVELLYAWPDKNFVLQSLFPMSSYVLLPYLYDYLQLQKNWISTGAPGKLIPLSLQTAESNDGSAPSILGVLNSKLLFAAYEGNSTGPRLWRTNGTEKGTFLLKDIDICGSDGIVENNIFYFTASDKVHGCELWRTDGTLAGTWMVKDVIPGSGQLGAVSIASLNGTIYFAPYNEFPSRFYRTDGTAEGTVEILDSNGNPLDDVFRLTAQGGALYFSSRDHQHGYEPWISDGTSAGTRMLKDICPGTCNSDPGNFQLYDRWVYFGARDSMSGIELYRTDGTPDGTGLFREIAPGTEGSLKIEFAWGRDYFHIINGLMYFFADDLEHGFEPWRSDGTQAGTFLLKDTSEYQTRSYYSALVKELGGLAYLTVAYSNGLGRIWKSDGTSEGTVELPIYDSPDTALYQPREMSSLNGYIYFSPHSSAYGSELFRTDGTATGTSLVADIAPGEEESSVPHSFTALGDRLFFGAYIPGTGYELMMLDTDLCPRDPNKLEPGRCGCGIADTDSDFDGVPDCLDSSGGIKRGRGVKAVSQ